MEVDPQGQHGRGFTRNTSVKTVSPDEWPGGTIFTLKVVDVVHHFSLMSLHL